MKNRARLALSLVVIAFTASQGRATSIAAEAPAATIKFYVYYLDPKGQIVARPNVEVARVGAGAVEHLGTTNAAGKVTVAASNVFKPDSITLLFCDPRFKEHCAAVRLDSKFLQGFEEFNVELPIFKLIDRVNVNPR
jgi:hypothetical protein